MLYRTGNVINDYFRDPNEGFHPNGHLSDGQDDAECRRGMADLLKQLQEDGHTQEHEDTLVQATDMEMEYPAVL